MIHSDDYEHLNFDLVPSHKHMGLARGWMDDASARLSLKTALEALVDDGYDDDFMLIDCPPDLSVLTDAAFIAAQNVFLAAQTQATSRDALDDLWDQLESIKDNQQIEIAIVGLLANMYRDDGQSQKFLELGLRSRCPFSPTDRL